MIFRFSVIATMLLSSATLFAYEQPTHRKISEYAFDSSSLMTDPTFIKRLGFSENGFDEILSTTVDGLSNSAREWISEGAHHEDEGLRSLSHFYNPITNAALTWAIPLGGKPSPDWVLINPFPSSNDNSYIDAVDSYHRFLMTAPSLTNNDRKDRLNDVFFRLGHIIHHIEDMAQPEHVRDDQHLTNIDHSWYEDYSLEQSNEDDSNFSSLMKKASSPVHLYKARDYWDSENLDGLAEFTNTNFVSNDSNFVLDGNMINIDERFPFPEPLSIRSIPLTTLMPENGEGLALCQKLVSDFQQFQASDMDNICKLGFIETSVIGKHPVVASINERASTVSFFDRMLEKEGKRVRVCTTRSGERTCLPAEAKMVTTLNRFNFEAAYPYLIPRAVNYSAGMLDHFFRGKLLVTNASPGQSENETLLEVQNISKLGAFEFSLENMSFQAICAKPDITNFQVHSLTVIGNPVTIAPQEKFTIIAPRTCTDIIIFGRGLIGEDEGIAVGRVEYKPYNGYLPLAGIVQFREQIFAGGNIERRVELSGSRAVYSPTGEFIKYELFSYPENQILSTGSISVVEIPATPENGQQYTNRIITYNNYAAKETGCYGGCPFYILNGTETQQSRFSWETIERNYTKTPIDFMSYVKNWYPAYNTDGPPGQGWSQVSDLFSEATYQYYWTKSYPNGPQPGLNAVTIDFSTTSGLVGVQNPEIIKTY